LIESGCGKWWLDERFEEGGDAGGFHGRVTSLLSAYYCRHYGRSTIRYGSGVAIARLTLDGTNEDFD
jgi:hypothetical protein